MQRSGCRVRSFGSALLSPQKSCRLRKDAAPDYSQLHGRPYLKHWREWEGRERGHAGQRWREMGFGDAVREDTQGRDGRK